MPYVSDVAELVNDLSNLIKNTREIINAVNDSRKYLEQKFPGTKQDFSDLLSQMQRTVIGLAEVTKIVNGFRFAFHESVLELEPALRELTRFNDYAIEQRTDIAKLQSEISNLKTDCEKIKVITNKLSIYALLNSFDTKSIRIKIKLIQELIEYKYSNRQFRRMLNRALDVLQFNLGWISNWRITNGTLCVELA